MLYPPPRQRRRSYKCLGDLRPKLPQPRVESEQVPAGRPLHFQEGISVQRSDAGGRLRPYTRHPSRRHRAFRGCGSAKWSGQSKTGLLALRPILGWVRRQVKKPTRSAGRISLQLGKLLVYGVTGKVGASTPTRDSAHEPFLIICFALWKYSLGTEILYFSSTRFRYWWRLCSTL